jgi:hypothetical protein
MEEINTFWLRGPKTLKGRGEPITLVAYSALNNGVIRYSTATHCPPDKFVRKHAHNKVIGRLKSTDNSNLITVDNAIGPEVSIVIHILRTCKCVDETINSRIVTAAEMTLPILIDRWKKRTGNCECEKISCGRLKE